MRPLALATLGLIGMAAFAQDVDRASLPKNVLIEDGKQIVKILAKGSYIPQLTAAKANIPTTLKIYTQATFDCTLALTIPNLGYRKVLPRTGETLIEIPAQKEGAELQGVCSMAMYSFLVTFH